jgi:DNA-binding MltR family transcriptional regulator
MRLWRRVKRAADRIAATAGYFFLRDFIVGDGIVAKKNPTYIERVNVQFEKGRIDGKHTFLDPNAADRSVIIMACSHIEQYLLLGLCTRFRRTPGSGEMEELFEGYGPLSTFAARIAISDILGLLTSDMRHDLNIMKKIRNVCAHSNGPVSFDDQEIASRCQSFKLYTDAGITENTRDISNRHKQRFCVTCQVLLAGMAYTVARSLVELEFSTEHGAEINERAGKKVEDALKKGDVGTPRTS